MIFDMTIREYYNKMRNVDITRLKEEAVEACKDLIIRANQDQLREGQNAKGQLIRPAYSVPYMKKKRRMSSYHAPIGTPDLFLNGDFQGAMDVIVENGQYDIVSWDEKNVFLQLMYDDIFGLNDESRATVRPFVTRKFGELLKMKLN